tara:strand:+ start:573 stop:1526 length:954 start_codon:yes stop_codon:yes gene_type:complete
MNKLLYIGVFVVLLITNANSSDVSSTRQYVSDTLNTIVKDLKLLFKDVDISLGNNFQETQMLKEDVEYLVTRSEDGESNPTVLNHGKANISDLTGCDYNSQNIHWTGSEWKCQNVNILSDCTAASDEYRFENSTGSYTCQKHPENSSVNYYWNFVGYSIQCNLSTGEHMKVYGCFYKDKQSKIIQVDLPHCSGKAKPIAPVKTCISDWQVGNWSVCSKTCGGGTQTRSVLCPSGYVCTGTKPTTSQTCNTQSCVYRWYRNGGKSRYTCGQGVSYLCKENNCVEEGDICSRKGDVDAVIVDTNRGANCINFYMSVICK